MPSESSIRRYVRRHVHKNTFEIFISCLPGLEHDTYEEVRELAPGFLPKSTRGGLITDATLPHVYRLNLGLGTANRILLRLDDFAAWSFPMLYDHCRRLFWPAFVPDPTTVVVHAATRASRLSMKQRVEDTVREAIAASFEGDAGISPGGASSIFVRIVGDRVTLSLDTTGEHLHKRGNKELTDTAPLRSTLASTALRRARRRIGPSGVVCDPFCGSGTILVEAARENLGLAPGAVRHFAFMDHPYYRPGTWRQTVRDDQASRTPTSGQLVGGDTRPSSIETTRANLTPLGGADRLEIDVEARDFGATLDAAAHVASGGVIVTNPPYGVRLGSKSQARALQAHFAESLRALPGDWRFGIFTPFPDLYERVGMEITSVTPIRVGGLRVSLVEGDTRM